MAFFNPIFSTDISYLTGRGKSATTISHKNEIIKRSLAQNNLAPARLWGVVALSPAVALRYTAGYAHHALAGLGRVFYAQAVLSYGKPATQSVR
jgi:hypothetical protein